MSAVSTKTLLSLIFTLGVGISFSSCEKKSKNQDIHTSASVGSGKSVVASRSPRKAHVSESNYGGEIPHVDNFSDADHINDTIPEPKPTTEFKESTAVTESLPPMTPVTPVEIEQPRVAPVGSGLKVEKGEKARKDIVVTANAGDQIIVADDDNVTVKGEGGIVMISGRCIKLKLESNKTEVYCDIANNVEITGNGNSVTLGTMGNATVSGSENKMTWESSFEGGVAPKVQSTGQDNLLQQRPM